MYFVKENSLLKKFEMVDIEHVPIIENQEANDLAQISSGYRVSKEILEELIEVRDKLISNSVLALELSKTKLAGVEELGDLNPNFFETFAIDNLSNDDWRKQIIEFLKYPMGITN